MSHAIVTYVVKYHLNIVMLWIYYVN